MTNNLSYQEICAAYEALDELFSSAMKEEGFAAEAHYQTVIDALPPKPKPTMADIKWDYSEHFLAEAEYGEHTLVVMVKKNMEGNIECFIPKSSEQRLVLFRPKELVPTGKHYTLKEVDND